MFKRNPRPEAGLSQFSRKISRFRKRGPVTVIDFDGDYLRIVQASPQGEAARVTRAVSVRFAPGEGKVDAASFGMALKKALEEHRIKPREVIFALSRSQVVLRPLQVPMVANVQELSSVVNFQISKDLPFRLEDAVVDFKVLRALESAPGPEEAKQETEPGASDAEAEGPAPRLEVLVGAVKKEHVSFHQMVAQVAGMKLAGLALRSTGVARVMAQCYPAEAGVSTAVISVRHDEVTIEIIDQNGLVFSRVAGVPPAAAGEESERPKEGGAEGFLNRLGVEVVRSLHSYEGMMGHEPVRKMLVVGGTGLENEISKSLAGRVNVPVEQLDPSDCIRERGAEKGEASVCFPAIGLAHAALQPGGLPLDFANPKKPAVQRNTKRLKMLAAAVAGLMVLITIFGVRAHLIGERVKIREAAQLELTDAEKKQKIYRATILQARQVNAWLAQEELWLDHLAYISSILPGADQVYVSALTTTSPNHVIRMAVQAQSGEILSELDKKLRAAGYEVKPLSITPSNDKYGYNFRTTVEVAIPKGMKPPGLKEMKPPPGRPGDDSIPKTALRERRKGREDS